MEGEEGPKAPHLSCFLQCFLPESIAAVVIPLLLLMVQEEALAFAFSYAHGKCVIPSYGKVHIYTA